MGDKHSHQRFPEGDTSSASSASGTAKSQTRYKPLVPKGPVSGELRIPNLAALTKENRVERLMDPLIRMQVMPRHVYNDRGPELERLPSSCRT
jgi:hypothetical protein